MCSHRVLPNASLLNAIYSALQFFNLGLVCQVGFENFESCNVMNRIRADRTRPLTHPPNFDVMTFCFENPLCCDECLCCQCILLLVTPQRLGCSYFSSSPPLLYFFLYPVIPLLLSPLLSRSSPSSHTSFSSCSPFDLLSLALSFLSLSFCSPLLALFSPCSSLFSPLTLYQLALLLFLLPPFLLSLGPTLLALSLSCSHPPCSLLLPPSLLSCSHLCVVVSTVLSPSLGSGHCGVVFVLVVFSPDLPCSLFSPTLFCLHFIC